MKTMIKINEITKLSNPEETVDKRTTYLMTKNPDMTSIKDVEDGTQLDITHVCRFTDTNKEGNEVEIETSSPRKILQISSKYSLKVADWVAYTLPFTSK